MIVHSCKTKYLIIFCEILTAFKMYLSIQYATKLIFQDVNLLYIYLKNVLKIIKAQIIKNLLLIYLMTSGTNKTMTAFKVLQSFWYNFHK